MKDLRTLMGDLEEAIELAEEQLVADKLIKDFLSDDSIEDAAKWDRAYINDLPDSAFIYVEPGYKEGENKGARHLPYKDKSGSVDLPHLRNALARCNQIKPVLEGSPSASEMRKTACSRAQRLAKKHLKSED